MSRAERLWIGGLGVYLTAWLALTTWQVSLTLPGFVKACEADDKPGAEQGQPATAPPSPRAPASSPAASAVAPPATGAATPAPPAATPSPSPSPSPRALEASERRRAANALGHPYLLWLLGCLGASVSALWAFVRRLAEQRTDQDRLSLPWIPYYIVRPPIGGVVGLISVLGLDFLQFRPTSCAPLLFLAFAAGLVSRQATLKLREVSLSLFTSQEYIREQQRSEQRKKDGQ